MYRLLLYQILALAITKVFSQSVEPLQLVPFEVIENHVFIELRVNDSNPLNFIFDSGATETIVNKRTAEILGLPIHKKTRTGGINGRFKTEVSKNNSISIGKIHLKDVDFELSPLIHFEQKLGTKVDGFIGYSLLKYYVVKLDNESYQISIFDPDTFVPSKDYKRIDIPKGKLCIIDAKILSSKKNKVKGEFIVDTGSGIPLLLGSFFVTSNEILGSGDYTGIDSITGYAPTDLSVIVGQVPLLEIEGFVLRDVKTATLETNNGLLRKGFLDGIIGYPLLNRFNIIFDLGRKRTYWHLNKSAY